MNWIELQDNYVVSGWWPNRPSLQTDTVIFVTLLDLGTVWRVEIRPKSSPTAHYTRQFEEILRANKNKPYLVVDNVQGKVVYLEDATKNGVLQFIKQVVGGADFTTIFKSAGDASSLRTMDFTPVTTDDLCSGEYIQKLRKEYSNGSVVLKSFHTHSNEIIKTIINNACISTPLMAYFLVSNPSIQSGLEDLKATEPSVTLIVAEALDSNRLLGDLLTALRNGGAYSGAPSAFSCDLQITAEFLQTLTGKESPDAMACAICGAWTPFFFDVAWDYTFIIIHPDSGNIHFLYMTDTD